MQISGYRGLEFWKLEAATGASEQADSSPRAVGMSGSGDRVSISAEAWRLMEEQKSKAVENSRHARGIREEEEETVESIKARAKAQGEETKTFASGGQEQVAQLEKQIEALEEKIQEIMQSSMSDEQKEQATGPLYSQINQLRQQLQALLASLQG
ncbi:hypothetical protein [Oleidesulfovibrio sp.]|uniref:hypothetical protein n=1 Tax=Oleidesulfovibrio sp. TaxID=2909707 RepID=UPI003A8381E8